MPAAGMPSPIDSNRPSPGGAADMSPSTLAATQVRSPAPGASNSRASMMRPSSAAGLGRSSVFARPSMLLGGRPSVVTDMSNVFAEAKIHDAHLEIFETDVVMEGELSKKGESGLQTWKNRMFVLRGQELSYYTPDNKSKQRYGVLKGSMNVRGAVVERVDNLSFSIALDDAVASSSSANAPRVLAAPSVQALFDWMTAISIASEAHPIPPPEAGLSLVDHSRTTHVILVRHGHYATSQTPSDDLNGPLTELGVRQARATGKFVYDYLNARMVTKRFPQGFPIVHSGVRRSVETAKYMAEAFSSPNAVELRENKLFREAWPGNPLPNSNRKMLAREKLDNMVSDCARLKVAYRTFFRHLIPTDLRDQQRERKLTEAEVEQFMATIGARGSTQSRLHDRYRVVVCHANIIRWFVCKAMGVDPDGSWGRMRHNHAAITTLEIDSVGNVQVATVNSTGHLSTDLLSEA